MALNCDFEGIDNDLLINHPSPFLATKNSRVEDQRKPFDGFTRSQYNIFQKNSD